LNVYCGLGLHEASHILNTREMYGRLARGMARERRLFENLWEDERIEDLVRKESPGFAVYIQSAKHELLERGSLGEALNRWDELPDLDRVNATIFSFIRIPHRITPAIQKWPVLSGECVFETLRTLFPHGPRDESDVEDFGAKLETMCARFRKLYPSTPEE